MVENLSSVCFFSHRRRRFVNIDRIFMFVVFPHHEKDDGFALENF